MKRNRKISTILFLALFGFVNAVPVAAASLEFAPPSESYTAGCQRTFDVFVDTEGQQSNAVDVIFTYPADQVTVNQITEGTAYEAVIISPQEINGNVGTARVTAFSLNEVLNGRARVIRIYFTSAPSATSANFNFVFTLGSTTDSNVADYATSQDILTSVVNATYTFTAGQCATDTTPPQVTFVSPANGEENFPVDQDLQFSITDSESGVDIDTLVIILNGITYLPTDPEVTVGGSPTNYVITLNPADDLPTGSGSTLTVQVRDLTGNPAAAQNIFNVPTTGGETPGEEPGEEPGETPQTPIFNVINNITDALGRSPINFENTPFEGTVIKQVFEQLGTAGTIATIGLLANLLQLLSLINTGVLLNLFALLLPKKKRRPWGLILDRITGKPVGLATCRIYLSGTLSVVGQTVSDAEGRYGFTLRPGKYRLEVLRNSYEKFSREIDIREGESAYVLDVFLTPLGLISPRGKFQQAWRNWWRNFKAILAALYPYIFALGFALSFVSIVLQPTTLNLIVFIAYVLIAIVTASRKIEWRPRYAAVIDASTGLRIPNALVKVFSLDSSELIDTLVTNESGLFDYYGPPGEYAVLVAARGYTFPSKQNTLPLVDNKYSAMVRAKLSKGGNNVQLFVDSASVDLINPGGNLATPFG